MQATPKDQWFVTIGSLLLMCNLFDALFTLVWVGIGVEEANPLMKAALDVHPVVFVISKLALVGLGVSVLWTYRQRAFARVALLITSIFYVGVVALLHLPAVVMFP